MSFSDIIKRKNVLLLPFSWLYKAGVFVFHKLYDVQILSTYKSPVPAICVGNLSVGGTGKSPMVEYILRLLSDKYRIAVISRGYRRKTKGFVLAGVDSTANDIGDEPMQFHQKFPGAAIAVGEDRAQAISQLLQQRPETEAIILDDAFQHRAVVASLNILLTEQGNIFSTDWYLPAGSLRDLKSNYKRADIIVVTKCDPALSLSQKTGIVHSIQPLPHQKIFFAAIDYDMPYDIFTGRKASLKGWEQVVLITGIANPQPLVGHLKSNNVAITHLNFPDHHHFTESDIGDILGTYKRDTVENKVILTTEKDAMRLKEWSQLKHLPVFALPVAHRILFEEQKEFDEALENAVNNKR